MGTYKDQFNNLSVDHFGEIQSTSKFLKLKAKSLLEPSLCVADVQTEGYGQRGSHWVSDQSSITFSLLLPVNYSIDQMIGFSQLLALNIKQTLESYTEHDYKVKWPNDIYLSNSKVAGTLVEVVSQSDNVCWVVIGVGINIGNFNYQFDDYFAQGVRLSEGCDKHALTSQLVSGLLAVVSQFTPSTWLSSKQIWLNADYFMLRETVRLKTQPFDFAYYLGLSDTAGLLVEPIGADPVRDFVEITAGQVSIRKVKDGL